MLKLIPLFLIILSGCAVGSATAGISGVSLYSVSCKQAMSLSKEAEDSLILKMKKEINND